MPRENLAALFKHRHTVLGLAVGSKLIQREATLGHVGLVDEDEWLVTLEGRVHFSETIRTEKVVLGQEDEDALRCPDVLFEVANLFQVVDICMQRGKVSIAFNTEDESAANRGKSLLQGEEFGAFS